MMADDTQSSIPLKSASNKRSTTRKKTHGRICTLNQTVHEYAASATAHGIAYIFEPNRWKLERLFWILVVGFALIFRYTIIYILTFNLVEIGNYYPGVDQFLKTITRYVILQHIFNNKNIQRVAR